jgi:hypothetical protein
MSESRMHQGRGLGSLREVCEHYRIQQRASARLGSGIKPAAVQVMMSKIEPRQEAIEGSAWKR